MAARRVWTTAGAAEREPRMAAHAKFVFCEQSIERSIAWICRNRRLAKDYERKVQTSECLLKVAMIRLMLKRLGRN